MYGGAMVALTNSSLPGCTSFRTMARVCDGSVMEIMPHSKRVGPDVVRPGEAETIVHAG